MSQLRRVQLMVNGSPAGAEVEVRMLLSDFLRQPLGLTGTHVGCEHGVCGACTVLLDGEPVRSCLTLAVQAHGREVTTVEGLAPAEGGLSPLAAAFRSCYAVQCGFCTAGILITATAFLRENPAPSERQVREALSGNLCRCTGYNSIVAAVLRAAEGGNAR